MGRIQSGDEVLLLGDSVQLVVDDVITPFHLCYIEGQASACLLGSMPQQPH